MKLNTVFSRKLFSARSRLGYTQSQVAEAVSITLRWYQRIERGERVPSFPVALSLMSFLGIEIHDLSKAVSLIVPLPTN